MRLVRAAVTETINAYRDMPTTKGGLDALANRLDELRDANVAHNVALVEAAAALGARAVGLGELCTAPYFALDRHPLFLAMAEPIPDGPSTRRFAEVARRLGVVIVAPLYELDGDRRYNTAVVIDADGAVLGRYRKTHIPHGENEAGRFIEPFYFGPADERAPPQGPKNRSTNPYFPVFETAVGRVGVAICYDRHFEGVMRSLARQGAELVFSPAVTFGEKSARMWEMEFLVDAARHNLFIAGSNRLGREPPWGQPFFGQSHFAGPNGKLPTIPAPPGLVVADLDLDALHRPDPAGWQLGAHRRVELYDP